MLEEIILPDGTTRKLGNIIPTSAVQPCEEFPEFGTTEKTRVIPRSEWVELVEQYDYNSPDHPHLPPVHDQDGVGQCNTSTTTAMGELCRSVQGLEYIALSAADLYHRINGGRDRGSLLEDAMREMMQRGVGTVEECGYLWKRGEWKGEASAASRAKFKMLEVYICPTFDHCFSAILQGFALNTGIMWYGNYTPTPSDPWLPKPRGNAGGHAIMGYKPTMRGRRGYREFGIWHQNSWGPNWPYRGANGKFVIPESAYTGPVGGWFAVRVMTDEGGVVPAEKQNDS